MNASGPPAAPTDCRAERLADGGIKVSWQSSSSGTTWFMIYVDPPSLNKMSMNADAAGKIGVMQMLQPVAGGRFEFTFPAKVIMPGNSYTFSISQKKEVGRNVSFSPVSNVSSPPIETELVYSNWEDIVAKKKVR